MQIAKDFSPETELVTYVCVFITVCWPTKKW